MIKWRLPWGKTRHDETDQLAAAQERLADARKLAANAQPTVQKAAKLWRTNHLGEAAAAALQHYGSRP